MVFQKGDFLFFSSGVLVIYNSGYEGRLKFALV